ncbi:hypothetical protein RESH_03870 [Rhodopirellula europaea SH398]|uniref:Uncharacterized protein n=1 Tax=Rhodopirellula europaea SH398 TaxID=1263868 RepID=M5SH46_9BACT|nr:hypothetical protein RESH_03870 [Rhodopirellula europaea SH398]
MLLLRRCNSKNERNRLHAMALQSDGAKRQPPTSELNGRFVPQRVLLCLEPAISRRLTEPTTMMALRRKPAEWHQSRAKPSHPAPFQIDLVVSSPVGQRWLFTRCVREFLGNDTRTRHFVARDRFGGHFRTILRKLRIA